MKRFVLLAIFVIAQGITGFPRNWYHPDLFDDNISEDKFDYLEEKSKEISNPEVKTKIKLPYRIDFSNFPINTPFLVNIDTSNDANDKSALTLPLLHTIHHQLNKVLNNLHKFGEAVNYVIKDLVTKTQSTPVNIASNNKTQVQVTSSAPDEHTVSVHKNQSTPVNIASNNKTQVQVTSSAPDEHTVSVHNQQFTPTKINELEDDIKKLEDNKNPVIFESTVSSNVPKENENLALYSATDNIHPVIPVIPEIDEKEQPDSEDTPKIDVIDRYDSWIANSDPPSRNLY